MKIINTLITISLTSLLLACAHHKNVRPAADGEHYIKLSSATKSEAGQEAIKQSNHFCAEQEKQAFVINETIEYTGSMPEEQYLTTRNIAGALKAAGTTMWALGQNKVDNAGAALALGGGAAESSLGQPYQLEMTFTCN